MSHYAVFHSVMTVSCLCSVTGFTEIHDDENPIKLDLTAVQGNPRSSILVSIKSLYVTSY